MLVADFAVSGTLHQHTREEKKRRSVIYRVFLATLVALDFTLVSQSVGRSFKLA